MALTRKLLKSMGIEDEKIDQIIEAHAETVDALKAERDGFKEKAGEADSLAKERDSLRTQVEQLQKDGGDAAKVQAEFDAYKKQVETEKANTGKTEAVRKLLKGSGVERDTFLDLLMGRVDLDKVTLDENGAVKDADSFIKGMKEDYADCFGKVETANPGASNPLSGGKNGAGKKTREEIMKIEDYGERMKAISENLEAFGYAPR